MTDTKIIKTKNDYFNTSLILLAIVFLFSFYIHVKEILTDLNVLSAQGTSVWVVGSLGSGLFVLALLPMIFLIGIYYKKKWARLGLIVVSFVKIGTNLFYMYSMRLYESFYLPPVLWIIFYLTIVFILYKYRKLFNA